MTDKHDTDVPEGTSKLSTEEASATQNLLKSFVGSKDSSDFFKIQAPISIHEGDSALERNLLVYYPEYFCSITRGTTPEERMLFALRFAVSTLTGYLMGKKPYNPLTYERCVAHFERNGDRVDALAEQISHHPPGIAFYNHSKGANTHMHATLMVKASLNGIGSFKGQAQGVITIEVRDHDEVYTYEAPAVVLRGLLMGRPFMDVNGHVKMVCAKTNMVGEVIFKEKPWLRGAYGKVAGTVHSADAPSKPFYEISGNWRTEAFFQDLRTPGKEKELMFKWDPAQRLRPIYPPIEEQSELDSHRLWLETTTALKAGDTKTAHNARHILEEKQRAFMRLVNEGKRTLEPAFFTYNAEKKIFDLRPDYQDRMKTFKPWISDITLEAKH